MVGFCFLISYSLSCTPIMEYTVTVAGRQRKKPDLCRAQKSGRGGNRTHRGQCDCPPHGFEGRDRHQTASASACSIQQYGADGKYGHNNKCHQPQGADVDICHPHNICRARKSGLSGRWPIQPVAGGRIRYSPRCEETHPKGWGTPLLYSEPALLYPYPCPSFGGCGRRCAPGPCAKNEQPHVVGPPLITCLSYRYNDR